MLTCALKGHITYAPDESGLRDRLVSQTAGGQSWRCLRCGTFVPGKRRLAGPASDAPRVRRGYQLRSVFILRLFAVERMVRAIIVALAAYAVWRFQYSRSPIEQAFDRELPLLRPLFRQLGYDIDHSKLVATIRRAFAVEPVTLRWLAAGLAAYALIEIVEAVGLWLAKRWGEYFAMVATSAGLPIEIYELAHKITFLSAGAFLVNVALVVYLVCAKRLFGVRGGRRAYEARLRSESIIETELSALAGGKDQLKLPGGPGGTAGSAQAAGPRGAAGSAQAAGPHGTAGSAQAAGPHGTAGSAQAAGPRGAAGSAQAAGPHGTAGSAKADGPAG